MFLPHLPRVAFALASLICVAALSPNATRTFTLTSSASASEASQAAAQDSDQAKPAAKPEQDKPEPAKPEPSKPELEKAAAEKAAPEKPQLEKPLSEKSEPEQPRQEASETGKKPSSKLPWAKSRTSIPASGTTSGADRRASTARDLLVNLEDSQLANFRDGEALSVNEEETLTRVLFRLPKFGPYDTFRLAHKVKVDDWAPFVDEPDSRRVQLFELRGRATNVERIDLLPEVAKRFEFKEYYRVTLKLDSAPNPVLVCARQIAKEWIGVEGLNEPASVRGLYLKVGDKSGDAPQLVFAADRVEWHPESENEQFGVLADHVLLARHGFDQSRFADIVTRDGKPLTAADTECFYGMMSAVKKIDPAETRSAPQFELGPFLQKPRDQHGKLRTVYGRAKRITRISLSDPTLKERFGVDGYYEIEVMAPLGDQEVRLPRGPDDKDPPVITVAFPIVCCVLDVPERLRNVADREDLNEDMILRGFNFRLWSYQSQFLDDFSRQRDGENPDDGPLPGEAPRKGKADRTGPRRQPSPMFIAARADFLPPRETGASNFGTWIGIGLIALIGGVFFANWWFNRSSPAPRRTTAERPKFD